MLFVPAAGHRDVRGGGGGVLAQHQVPGAGGFALGAVDGGGVGELDVLAGVGGGEGAQVGGLAAAQGEAAVVADGGDGPGVAVGHAQVAVVAPGRDPVPDPEPLPGVGDDRVGVVDWPAATSRSRIAPFNAAACSRVSASINIWRALPISAPDGASAARLGQRLGAFGVTGVDPDLAAAPQRVPHLCGRLTIPLTNRLTSRPSISLAYGWRREGVGGEPVRRARLIAAYSGSANR